MSKDKKGEIGSVLESPRTITKRIEGQFIRGVLDEERKAQKALSLLKARHRKIALLEEKIVKLKNDGEDGSRGIFRKASMDKANLENSSNKETAYLSFSASRTSDPQKFNDEEKFEKNGHFVREITKLFGEKENLLKESIMSFKSIKSSDTMSRPNSTLASACISNSELEAAVSRNVSSDSNVSLHLTSDESGHDDSSVNLVVTAALAFSKFDNIQSEPNEHVEVSHKERAVNDDEDKKHSSEKSSKKNLISTRFPTSLPGIKTRLSKRHRKRLGRKIERTLEHDLVNRNLEKVQTGVIESPQQMTRFPHDDAPKTDASSAASTVQKQRVEDKVAGEDAQEAAPIPDLVFASHRQKLTSTQTPEHSNGTLDDPKNMNDSIDPRNQFSGQTLFSGTWSTEDEPAPQWLIEEALKRGDENTKNHHRSANENCTQSDVEDNNSTTGSKAEGVIYDLEKQLCMTKTQLAEALNEQLNIKNKYKRALKDVKAAADEERDRLQQKIVQICTSVLEKFGPQALKHGRIKMCPKKRQRPLQNFGKVSKKLHRKIKLANRISSELKEELKLTKTQLEEKSRQYDSMMKCFSSLRTELKRAESSMNDLLNENLLLRKKIEETREWVYTRVNKERHEKMNSAQFREIQRSRELANLKTKSQEDIATIAQLRSKLSRIESANANKGFLLNNYKAQLADLAKDKATLSNRINELELDNSSLRSANAQLQANFALINENKQKLGSKSEKSGMDIRDHMSVKIPLFFKSQYFVHTIYSTLTIINRSDSFDHETLQNTMLSTHFHSRRRVSLKADWIHARSANNYDAKKIALLQKFLKKIDAYNAELDAERDFSCSEASEREAHETACEILNITPGELTGFLRQHSNDKINSWLSEMHKITTKKYFADNLGRFLFEKAISHTKN
ncbi:uncharacterized protein [Venturia canescens]|uniref:uncharacterized protein n=1 Tax=Venturia canescens TaxID=32260 RepID=UPI001C9BD06E|nr:uncharacterized protein LOC122412350 [Venturia canescens]